jgi:hypothetical protein
MQVYNQSELIVAEALLALRILVRKPAFARLILPHNVPIIQTIRKDPIHVGQEALIDEIIQSI